MLDGGRWVIEITKAHAYKVIKKCNLKVTKEYNTRREEWINGEPKTWIKKGNYAGWFIEVRKHLKGYTLSVRGSFHKFFHGNNKGLFTGKDLILSLQKMCDLFEVDSSVSLVKEIEVGVNLRLDMPIYKYLQLNLLYHRKKSPEEFEKPGTGYLIRHEDYHLKFYEKDYELFRFEIKYKTKEKLSAFGIKYLDDLNPNTVNKLAESLLAEWHHVILRDGLIAIDEKNNPHELTSEEIKILHRFTSGIYVQSYNQELGNARLKGNRNKSVALRVADFRLRNNFLKIIQEKGNTSHKRIGIKIQEALDEFSESWM